MWRSEFRVWRAVSTPFFSISLLFIMVLAGGACRSGPPIEGTVVDLDLVAMFPYAETWGPVEMLDLGSGEHKLNLLDGLYFGEREPDGRTYAWSWGDETSFMLTCPALRPRTIAITCRRLNVDALTDLRVQVTLNDTLLGQFTPGTDYVDHLFQAPAEAWQVGDNRLVLAYSEDVYLPDVVPGCTDQRRVAVQLDTLRVITGSEVIGEAGPPYAASDRLEFPLPSDLSWYLQVPANGLLAFGYAAELAAELRVILTPEGGPSSEISRRRLPAGGHVDLTTVDLTPWSGAFVRLTFAVDPVDASGPPSDEAQFCLLRPEVRAPQPPIATAPVPETTDGPRPDVVVYLMDALRTANLSGYGYQRRTSPVFDRLSRNSLLFRNAFAQAPNTVPSVKSLFTGRYLPFTAYSAIDEDQPTMAEVFSRAGYATALFSNNPNLGPGRGYHRGFDHVSRKIFFRKKPVKDFARQATDAVINWAGRLPVKKPLFAYVHTIHPHNPYEAPFPFDQAFLARDQWDRQVDLSTEALLDYAHGERSMNERTLERMRDFYDGDILYNDLELGRLLAWLRHSGRGRPTVIVFTSDHGEELGDHGGLLHGYTLYDEQIHVPLLLVTPSGDSGVLPDHVQLVDLAPTLFDYGRIKNTPTMEGVSLTGLISGEDGGGGIDRTVYSSASSAAGLYTLRTDQWKYVFAPRTRHLWGMGQGLGRTRVLHYLFDLENDPGEMNNLADEMSITRKALQARLLGWIDQQALMDEGGEEGSGVPDLDEDTRQRLIDLGYIME